eukprot:TRINITY_DN33089_c0_g1_i1.p1 TRINITY_DN33089_c0_g1~~TRINITY_DN33089_c0_g1_i1.p1  ORF type:complete len:214 (+),score=51.57 TRINITY_DN33089_c0_g1_i1:930-1571(+)
MDFFEKFPSLFSLQIVGGSLVKWFKKLRNKSKFSYLVLPENTGEDAVIEEIQQKYVGSIYCFKFGRLANFLKEDKERQEYEDLKKEIADELKPDLLASSLYERITSKLISELFETIGKHIKGKKILFICNPSEFRTLNVPDKRVIYSSVSEEVFKSQFLQGMDAETKATVSSQRTEIMRIKLKNHRANYVEYEAPEELALFVGSVLKIKPAKK